MKRYSYIPATLKVVSLSPSVSVLTGSVSSQSVEVKGTVDPMSAGFQDASGNDFETITFDLD